MMRTRKGFTLIEILIVVIILGILAAIVIPQFTEASNEARESSLRSNLHTLRGQIGLYKAQHLDVYPDGTSSDTFELALTQRTDIDGTQNASGDFGPYMQQVPLNPFMDRADALFSFGAAPGDDASHWMFNSDDTSATYGSIWANDSRVSPDGTNHSDL